MVRHAANAFASDLKLSNLRFAQIGLQMPALPDTPDSHSAVFGETGISAAQAFHATAFPAQAESVSSDQHSDTTGCLG